jgi:hypothetical protein
MREGLKEMRENPFNRENPFKLGNKNFHSLPKNYG